jgi:hypothetical protein
MPTQFILPAGTAYPANAAGFKKALSGDLQGVDFVQVEEETYIAAADLPYPELAAAFRRTAAIQEVDMPENQPRKPMKAATIALRAVEEVKSDG